MNQRTRWIGWLLLAVVSLPWAGCGESESAATGSAPNTLCPAGQVRASAGACTTAGAEAGYRLDITQRDNPFPDDRYRDADGHIVPPAWSFLEFADPDALPKASSNFGNGLLTAI